MKHSVPTRLVFPDGPPQLAINDHGGLVVVYRSLHTLRSIRRTAGGSWQPSHSVIHAYSGLGALTLGGKGLATFFVDDSTDNPEDPRLVVLTSHPDGHWSLPKVLDGGFDPHAVIGPKDRVTLAWWSESKGGVFVTSRRPHHRWTRPRRALGSQPPLTMAAAGDGRVFLSGQGESGRVLVSRMPGKPWRAEEIPAGYNGDIRLAAAGHGRAIAVLRGPPSKRTEVLLRGSDGTWTSPHAIRSTHLEPWPTITAQGHAAITADMPANPRHVGVARFTPRLGWTPLHPVVRGVRPEIDSDPTGAYLLCFLGTRAKGHPLKFQFHSFL
jgi:hypothetical protein